MASLDGRNQALATYTVCMSALGIGLLVWSLSVVDVALPGVLLFIGLVAIAEWTSSEVFASEIAFSISSAVTFATLLLYGPSAAALVGTTGGLVATIIKAILDRRQHKSRGTRFAQRALFNMAAVGLAFGAAGGAYLLCGGQTGRVAPLSSLFPAVVAAVLGELINSAIVVGAVSLQTGQPAWRIWKQNVSWAMPMNILGMVLGGKGLALGYQMAGVLGVSVFLLPILLSIYAYRLYVRLTKAHMARVEEMVAERVKSLTGGKPGAKAA